MYLCGRQKKIAKSQSYEENYNGYYHVIVVCSFSKCPASRNG